MNEQKEVVVNTEENKKNSNTYNNSSNTLMRISTKFYLKFVNLNEKREEVGFKTLSNPKISDLILRHKLFGKIEDDIIHFNTELEENKNAK